MAHWIKRASTVGASSHSNKRERKSSSQLLHTTTAKINKTNTKGETALHLAAKKGDLALIKSLIASGACVNQKDNAGWTAIHEASNRGFTEIIAELLKAGADVNSKSLDGVLPVHDAVSGNHFEAVHLLLFHGANPNETDNCGGNALDEATCDKMKDLLKSYGATETKESPRMNDVVGGKNVRPSRPRKIRTCYNCHDHLIFHSKPAGQKCGTNSRHKASLLGNGKVKTDSSVYQNPVQWIKALLGNDISVSWKYVWNKVTYCGTLLSKIIAENIPKETEVLLQQHKLSEWDHNEGEDYCCSGHQTTSFQDTDNIQQGVQNPLSTETQSEETLSAVIALKSSYQPTFSKTSRRFLQFNKIVLIKDEEFLPSHIMEQCWDFYVRCENFGF